MYERGWSALNLHMPDRVPHTEYVSNPDLVKAVTGLDYRDSDGAEEAWRLFYEKADYDFIWSGQTPAFEKGRFSWMGTAQFSETQDLRSSEYAFKGVEEVLSLDPVEEYGLPDPDTLLAHINTTFAHQQETFRTVVVPGCFYNTIFTWCIKAFGWELFMESAMTDPKRFSRVLDGFFRVSMPYFEAYAKSDIKVFICHDDIVWTQGPVFSPEWYRRYVFSYYPLLWQPLLDAGKILLFCSDGNYDAFVDDLAAAGAMGFIFEPLTDLEYVVKHYGQTHVIIGNADCRALTFGTREDVKREVDRCFALGRDCPGYFIAVGNHIPYNVPVDNALYYFDLVRDLKR